MQNSAELRNGFEPSESSVYQELKNQDWTQDCMIEWTEWNFVFQIKWKGGLNDKANHLKCYRIQHKPYRLYFNGRESIWAFFEKELNLSSECASKMSTMVVIWHRSIVLNPLPPGNYPWRIKYEYQIDQWYKAHRKRRFYSGYRKYFWSQIPNCIIPRDSALGLVSYYYRWYQFSTHIPKTDKDFRKKMSKTLSRQSNNKWPFESTQKHDCL